MSKIQWLSIVASALIVSGCGMRVPDIQEVGDWAQGQRFVQAIIINIKCELRDAIIDVRAAYAPQKTFLEGYGIETTLTLTLDEKGTLAPGVLFMPPSPPSSVFTFGTGLTLSSQANRKEVIDGYYLVSDLEKAKCSQRGDGPFLLQNDLKLREWLLVAASANFTGTDDFTAVAKAGLKSPILQHEVKFTIDSAATATPSWKLVRATINPSGNFITLDRTRTHDLVITLARISHAILA